MEKVETAGRTGEDWLKARMCRSQTGDGGWDGAPPAARLTVVEEFLLLVLDEETGRLDEGGLAGLRYPIAGAVLTDLCLAGRVALEDGTVRVVESSSTGVPFMDHVLQDLTRASAHLTVRGALGRIADWAPWIQEEVLDRLVTHGIVRRETGRRFGLFGFRRHPTTDGAREREVKLRLLGALLADGPAPARDAALVSAMDATGALGTLLSPKEVRRLAVRALGLRRHDPIARAVSEALADQALDMARAGAFPH